MENNNCLPLFPSSAEKTSEVAREMKRWEEKKSKGRKCKAEGEEKRSVRERVDR